MKQVTGKWSALLAIVLFAAVGQLALWAHVHGEAPRGEHSLGQPLSSLPLELGDWTGRDMPIDEQLQFADDALHRIYRHRATGQQVTLWIAYSAIAADRGHHPEVCMAVLGKPENRARRGLLSLPGHAVPAQRLHFGQANEATWAFYWHYALPRGGAEPQDFLQRLHRAARQLPPSVTLEVFAEDHSPHALEGAEQFAAAIDGAIQPLVGTGARRGHARLPITIATAGHTE